MKQIKQNGAPAGPDRTVEALRPRSGYGVKLPPARATLLLVAATVFAWVVVAAAGQTAAAALVGGFVPARLSGLAIAGALPVALTPLSATLLHGGILHVGMNMLMLGFCGRFVEPALRARGLLLLYVAAAYAAAAGQYAWSPHDPTPMIGASGAISGVLAAYALLYGERRVRGVRHAAVARWLHIAWLAAAWIGVNLLVALATRTMQFTVAVPAHVGGFVAGLLLTRPLLKWRFSRRDGGPPKA